MDFNLWSQLPHHEQCEDLPVGYVCPDLACPVEVKLRELGYASYCRGEKMSGEAAVSESFRAGWFAAADAREKFGEHESFLSAP